MSEEGEGPAMTWVREYNAQLITLDDLAKRIAGHDFRERKGEEQPTLARAIDYRDANYEAGTFDDVYRARAYGLLTGQDMKVIMERVKEREETKSPQEPSCVCQSADSPAKAPLIELASSAEPHLVKVDNGYIRVKVTQ